MPDAYQLVDNIQLEILAMSHIVLPVAVFA
jgi:hypothetical protein